MKSLPSPWYLTKWRIPLSLWSGNDVEELFSGTSELIAEIMRKLDLFGTEEMVFEFRMLGFWIDEDSRKKLKESWEEYENELWSTTANGQRWGGGDCHWRRRVVGEREKAQESNSKFKSKPKVIFVLSFRFLVKPNQ